MSECLPTLKTGTPEDGYARAIKLARIALNFATVAAADDDWRPS